MRTDTKWFDAYIPEYLADEEDYGRQRKDKATPEVHLASAVMERALMDLAMPGEERADALGWITSDDATWPFSFESLCVLLGLEPNATRERVLSGNVSSYARDFRRTQPVRMVSVQMRQQSRRRRKSVGEVAA